MAAGTRDDLVGGEQPAVSVDMLSEPQQDWREVPRGEVVSDGRVVFGERLVELGGVDAADGVGREVAEVASAPMHVLQHTITIGGGCDAKQILHHLVPCIWEFFDGEGLVDEGAFEFEPQDDVQAVGEFIRLDPDQRGAYLVDRLVPCFEADVLKLRWCRGLEDGVEGTARMPCSSRSCFPRSGTVIRGSLGRGRRR